VRKTVKALAFGAVAASLVLTAACSANKGSDDTGKQAEAAVFKIDYEGKAVTPRAEIPGAKPGGTITILEDGEPEHLDGPNIYVSNALSYSQLFHRALTGYIEPSKEGDPLQVVGDLATNAGVTTDGGKTWTYTLRDGIKFEDGSPITAADVKYGISRAFSSQGTEGPQFLQSALDADGKYKGPFVDPTGEVPGVTTQGDKVLKFTFKEPHLELPFLVAFPTVTPVQKAKDTKEKYETEWQSTGPYKRSEYVPGSKLVLEKNPNWDPKSDPIRKQYVDKIIWDFTSTAQVQTDRLVAANGGDANAVMVDNVPPTQIASVSGNAEVMKRVHTGPNQYVYYLDINMTRIKDVDIRRALNYAIDRDAYIKAVGGPDVASPATTVTSPVTPGYKKFDAYPSLADGHGDVEKAKKLLEGKNIASQKYVFCTANTPTNQTVGAVIIESLKRAGFDITLKLIDRAAYYTTIGKKGIDCDLMSAAWGQDYPDQETVLGTILDGSKIKDSGNNNYSYFDEPSINAKLKQYREMADRGAAAKLYGDLDQEIMEKFAPMVPLRYGRNFTIAGPNVGNTFLNQFSQFDLTTAFVK
jgi:peptide/nickel transport system substrate-binding protein